MTAHQRNTTINELVGKRVNSSIVICSCGILLGNLDKRRNVYDVIQCNQEATRIQFTRQPSGSHISQTGGRENNGE